MGVRFVPFLLAATLVAACGSTVQVSGQVTSGPGQVDASLGGTGTAGGGSTSGGLSVPATGGTGSSGPSLGATGGGSGITASSSGGSTGTAQAPGDAPSAAAPGVTASTVYLGFHIADNAGAANAAIGASGITRGDERQEISILLDDINKHGGIAGRKAEAVIYAYDANDTRPTTAIGEEACQYLTRDHKIFVTDGFISDNELTCLQKAGVWVMGEQLKAENDRDVYVQHPYYLEMGSPNLDRDFVAEVASLQRQRYFTPWNTSNGTAATVGAAKVGVLTFEYPTLRRAVTRTLTPQLKAAGFVPDTIYLPFPQSNGDLGAFSSAIASAVLKFRSDQVDHVIITDAGGTVSLLFMNQASSQGYYPRYGGDSNNGWQALLDSGAMQKSQLNGAVGVGWSPALDLAQIDNPDNGRFSNPERRRCVALYKEHGLTFSDTNAKGIGLLKCATIWGIQTVSDRARGALTRASAMIAAEGLGTAYRSPESLGQRFGPGRHDGLSGYYDWQYDPAKGRFSYVGPQRSF